MIRPGLKQDIPIIVMMAKEFWTHTVYDEPFCEETCWAMSQACIDQGLMAVYEHNNVPVGFACGVKGALLGNASVITGTEVAWWVNKDHRNGKGGIGLLVELERLAKKAGIKYWSMIYMESSMPATIDKIYQKMGYNRAESSYTKVL